MDKHKEHSKLSTTFHGTWDASLGSAVQVHMVKQNMKTFNSSINPFSLCLRCIQHRLKKRSCTERTYVDDVLVFHVSSQRINLDMLRWCSQMVYLT